MTNPPDSRRRGLVYILGATGIAGVCGYLIQLAAPALLSDAHAYLAFSVFWSTLYLFGSALSGAQQEMARAAHPAEEERGRSPVRTFAIGAAGVVAVGAVVVGLVLSPGAFSSAPVAMTVWFSVGLVGYVLMSVLAGMMYGLEMWRAIAALTVTDAVIRAVLVTAALALELPIGVIAALISVPFVLSAGILWLAVRRRVVGRYVLDVGPRRLSANTLSTAVGAGAMGVLVTGLPLLLRSFLPTSDAAYLAGLILVLTITRAPLIIPIMALQSFLVVSFRRSTAHLWGVLLRYLLILAAVTGAFAVAAWLWGPAVIDFISQGRFVVEPYTAAVVVVSAGLVASMCITGPALLARAQHRWFVGGWVLAAAATIVLLALPIESEVKATAALLVAPALGVIVHVVRVSTFTAEPVAQVD